MKEMKILLCATDAGGIRNIKPLIPICFDAKFNIVLITDKKKLILFDGSHNQVTTLVFSEKLTLEDMADLLEQEQPQAIICGTTCFDSPDRFLIPLGKKKGIKTIAVLDEWYNYHYRFENLQTRKLCYLPETIAVQDDLAFNEAIAEGLPSDILTITGSPALSELISKAISLADESVPLPSFLKGSKDKPVVTFISETHAIDYGSLPDTSGLLGPFIGYTEHTVRDTLFKVLGHLNEDVIFVEKFHPATRSQKLNNTISNNVTYHVEKDVNLWDLLFHSDVVIGMRSMALLEASILGCRVVSCQPHLIGSEMCTAVRLGLVPRIDNEQDLLHWITDTLKTKPTKSKKIHRYPFANERAGQLIVDAVVKKKEY